MLTLKIRYFEDHKLIFSPRAPNNFLEFGRFCKN